MLRSASYLYRFCVSASREPLSQPHFLVLCRRFLNRLLGLPAARQNLLFNYFACTLAAEIRAAKAEGKYFEGVSDLGGSHVSKVEPQVGIPLAHVLACCIACGKASQPCNSTKLDISSSRPTLRAVHNRLTSQKSHRLQCFILP